MDSIRVMAEVWSKRRPTFAIRKSRTVGFAICLGITTTQKDLFHRAMKASPYRKALFAAKNAKWVLSLKHFLAGMLAPSLPNWEAWFLKLNRIRILGRKEWRSERSKTRDERYKTGMFTIPHTVQNH